MKSINIVLYRKGLIKPFTVEVFRFDSEVLSVAPSPNSFIQQSLSEAYEEGFWYLECTDGSYMTVNMKNIDMVAWNSSVENKYSKHDMENIKIEATQVPDSFIIALFGKQKCDFSTAYKEKISEALNLLPPRDRYVITKRSGFFGLEAQDLMKVAKEFSVTRERIRQLEFRTLDKMRRSLGIQIDVDEEEVDGD